MTPVPNLDEALANLVITNAGDFVYYVGKDAPEGITPHAVIRENHGTSYVISLEDAKRLGLDTSLAYTWLTLQIKSSLEVAGLTTAVATTMNAKSIPVNVIAGFYYDHLLVPKPLAKDALHVLEDLSTQAKGWLPSA
ncbi:MAG: ACT domain-containing protein [Actinomycetaceae bacterium]|nr:ACT domain-containing protein [Actinomycetaceae bacterium]